MGENSFLGLCVYACVHTCAHVLSLEEIIQCLPLAFTSGTQGLSWKPELGFNSTQQALVTIPPISAPHSYRLLQGHS